MFDSLRSFWQGFDWSWNTLAKIAVGVVFIMLVISLAGQAFFGAQFGGKYGRTVSYDDDAAYSGGGNFIGKLLPSSTSSMGGGGSVGYAARDAFYSVKEEMAPGVAAMPPMDYSVAQVAPWMPSVNGTRNSEKYERTGYSATYETGRLATFCGTIEGWKPLEYVIFDSSNQSEYGCNYEFRVEKEKTDEIVAKLKDLNPKDWSVYTSTVAQGIEDTSDRIATLKTRLTSLNDTLAQAESAYNKLVVLATQSGKVGDLANILNSKLTTIERLTNDKLSLEEQIKQYSGGNDDLMDETAYTHFSVSVQKITIVDWRQLGDEWRNALQATVRELSQIVSWILLGLPALILSLVWYGLVFGICIIALAFFAKVLWKAVLKIWNS
jgi:hypothetical protein